MAREIKREGDDKRNVVAKFRRATNLDDQPFSGFLEYLNELERTAALRPEGRVKFRRAKRRPK